MKLRTILRTAVTALLLIMASVAAFVSVATLFTVPSELEDFNRRGDVGLSWSSTSLASEHAEARRQADGSALILALCEKPSKNLLKDNRCR
jgi:hypothetical protein